MTSSLPVLAGVALFLHRLDGRYVIMRRQGSHGAGTWGLPGGHIEFGESIKDAAVREVEEEIGVALDVNSVRIIGTSEAVFTEEKKHYVTVLCAALFQSPSHPYIVEPAKCSEIKWWCDGDGLPDGGLFLPLRNFLADNPGLRLY